MTRKLAIAFVISLTASCEYTENVGRTLPPLAPGHLELRWAVPIGGSEQDAGTRVVMTHGGDVIVAGESQGAVDFAAPPATLPIPALPPPPFAEPLAFVARRGSVDGGHVWGDVIEAGLRSELARLAIDSGGNLFAAGHVVNEVDPIGVPIDADMLLAKYAPDGTLLWQRGLGASSLAEAYGLVVQPDGSVVVTGRFGGTVDLGAVPIASVDPLVTSAGAYDPWTGDIFIAAFDADGEFLWGKAFHAPGLQALTRASLTASGDVIVVGYTLGSAVSLGGEALSGFFLARFTGAGGHVWSRALDLPPGTWVTDLSIDALDNLFVITHDSSAPAAALGFRVLDQDGELLDSAVVALPDMAATASAVGGMVVATGGSPGAVDGTYLAVSDQHGSALGESRFVNEAREPSPIDGPRLFGVAIGTSREIAVTGAIAWGVDLGAGVIWPHGAGPIDDTGLDFQTGGRDAIVALFDWVED